MLQLVVTVKLDLKSFHGTEIPCSVSFQDDNVISTVSSVYLVCIFMIMIVFNGRVRCVAFNCGREIMMIM